MGRCRIKLPNRCYHLISHVAHRAYFLDDDERTRLVDFVRHVAKLAAVEIRLDEGWQAAKGHDVVLTPSRYCYFSRRQGVSRDPFPYYEPEPFAEQKPKVDLTLEKAYGFDPYAGFSENLKHRILGVQASVWTESIFTRFDFEWKTWPRTCALAEIAWTGPGARTFDDFRKRMLLHRRRLVSNLVNCAPME